MEMRNERKFVFNESEEFLEKYLHFILQANSHFPPRKINSIYFDTIFHKNINEAIDGIMFRNKTRIRWYGEIFNSNLKTKLEKKVKINYDNYKVRKSLNEFKVENFFDLKKFKNYVSSLKKNNEEINFLLNHLYPNIFVSYFRKYFKFKEVRITLDTNLKFINIEKKTFFSNNDLVNINKKQIIELKFNNKLHREANHITNMLKRRLNKFSKYQTGFFQT